MPHLFDYAPHKVTEWGLRTQANLFDISFRAAVEMKLRYAVEASHIWLEAGFEPYYWQWVDIIIRLRGMKDVERKGGITDSMIEQAREVPITNLIEFDKNGKALAWCHDDKTPSLHHHKKANRAHCFPCGESFDPIAVLMSREGMTFVEAVRKLCG